jgi:WD domain, G-beta repeat
MNVSSRLIFSMMRHFALSLLGVCLMFVSSAAAHAQGTRLWSQSKFEELEKGKPDGVAITSDGHLVAGPESKLVFTTPSTYVWSVAADHDGNAYLATGTPATVLRVSPDGKSTKLFSAKDLTVQAVCIGPDGAVYAATLPSGKVYKLDPQTADRTEDNATVIFDSAQAAEKPKYVWDLAFDTQGRLYVATGGPAGIYRVAPGGKPELFFSSDEQHIRSLAFDSAGNLIAGSDGTGLVYRIDKAGKGYVIFDAPKREITSVTVGSNGVVYAASVGEKGRSNLPPLPVTGNVSVTATITIVQPGSVQAFSGNTLIPDGTEIYEIAPNGAPRKLWAGRGDIVYALKWTPDGLLAATGNRGRVYRIQESGEYADIAHLEASQVIGFADSARGIYLGTANAGRVYLMSREAATSGTYVSDVFDAGVFSQWGRGEVDTGAVANAKNFDLFARAGNVDNPQRAWSDWKKVTPNVGPLGVDPARFVQWKADLHAGADIASVGINYLPVNVAPMVDEIVVVPGARVNTAGMQLPQPQATTINFPASQNPNVVSFAQEPGREPLPAQKDKTAVTVRWLAHDDNGDDLTFSVYYRGDSEQNWQLLKDKVTDRYLSFDGGLLPDGPYRLRVAASDAPSHNPGEALTGEKVSDRFLVDTTPPTVADLTAKMMNGKIHVTLTAIDAATPIAHAEYSVDAGQWQYVEPVGKISDSLTERFEFDAPLSPPTPAAATPVNTNEHVITVRVYDRYDNAVATKAVVR